MKKLRLDWQGFFPMEEKTIRDKVEDRAGVFKISREGKDGGLKPVYVGQAGSVRTTLLDYLTSSAYPCVKEQLKKGGCQFRYAYLYEKADLDAAERALYRRYTPKCNESEPSPGAEEVEVNYN